MTTFRAEGVLNLLGGNDLLTNEWSLILKSPTFVIMKLEMRAKLLASRALVVIVGQSSGAFYNNIRLFLYS